MKLVDVGASRTATLEVGGSIDAARALAYLLVGAVIALVLALIFAPWQQSVQGAGRVVAYAPLERQQTVEAAVSGRVVQWHAQEGDHVEAGDLIVELADNDPHILSRLERQRASVQVQLEAAKLSITVAESKVASLETVRTATVSSAGLKRQMAENKREAAQQDVDAEQATLRVAQTNAARQRKLHEGGLASTRALELADLAVETSTAKLASAKAKLSAARREVKAMGADRSKADADSSAKISEGEGSLQKAKSDQAKLEGELAKIEVELSRQQTMQVVAPRAGTVFRLLAKEGGEVVKQGDALATLVPDTVSRAVEVWVDGNDAPLITPGRHVRVQFEGWPAVQFVGWPSVAVGTFPATVAFVDATDDGAGQFRVVVVPENARDWPEARYLRQGVRANAWILLNQVSLGYELWRQLNGFPPAVERPAELGGAGDKSKSADAGADKGAK